MKCINVEIAIYKLFSRGINVEPLFEAQRLFSTRPWTPLPIIKASVYLNAAFILGDMVPNSMRYLYFCHVDVTCGQHVIALELSVYWQKEYLLIKTIKVMLWNFLYPQTRTVDYDAFVLTVRRVLGRGFHCDVQRLLSLLNKKIMFVLIMKVAIIFKFLCCFHGSWCLPPCTSKT